MGVRLPDTIEPMGDFPAARAEHIEFSDGISLQDKFNNNELGGGGDSSSTVTQEEYEALPDEEKLNGLYYCYDSQRIYKNGVQYGESKPLELTYEEWKTLREAGAISDTQDCIVAAGADGIIFGAEDIGYSNAENGIQATTVQGAIDKVVEKVDGLISDTNLTSTTSTVSASKVKNAITYSFDTQSGIVKYVKFKPSITTISVVDIYGGKIEILGASKAAANPDYKTVKVVRLSYGDWGSYDATQVPSVVHTKIGELYYYPTDEYYYLKLYNYSAFTMTGLATAPEIITSLPAEESAMTLIPENDWVKIDDTTSSTESTWSSSKIVSYVSENSTPTYSGTVIPTAIANGSTVTTDWDISSAGSNADYGRLLMLNSKYGTFLIYVKGNLGSTSTVPTPTLISSIGNSQSASWSSSFELSISSNKLRIKNKSGAVASWRFV